MGLVTRILVVILAYVLACIAASIVLTIGALTPVWNDVTSLNPQTVVVWSVIGIGAAVIGTMAAVPTLLVIALAEGFAWRSILVYGALGGALALIVFYGGDLTGYAGEPESNLPREREVLAAAGIAGGLVYWLFAGRNAGSWKR